VAIRQARKRAADHWTSVARRAAGWRTRPGFPSTERRANPGVHPFITNFTALNSLEAIGFWTESFIKPRRKYSPSKCQLAKREQKIVLVNQLWLPSSPSNRSKIESDSTILIQRENPALPAKDECSDALSEPRTEQGGSESRTLWGETTALLLVLSLQHIKPGF
jgi:hypothetical protein